MLRNSVSINDERHTCIRRRITYNLGVNIQSRVKHLDLDKYSHCMIFV